MRKIPDIAENPVDHMLLQIADYIIPTLKATGHTPNLITTYSFALGLLAVFYLWTGRVVMFSAAYLASYFFDCVDGHMARRYKMTSEFGDMYDHITDILVGVALAWTAYTKYKSVAGVGIVAVFLFFTWLMFKHIGCQQQLKNNEIPESLDKLKSVCPQKEDINWTRYFGTGSYTLFCIAVVLYLDMKKMQ